MKNLNIKVKLIGGIIFFMLISFAVLIFANYHLSKNEIIKRIEGVELPAFTRNIKNEIYMEINEGVKPLYIMINDSRFKSYLQDNAGKTDEIIAYLKNIADRHGIVLGYISDKSERYFSSTGNSRQISKEKEAWYYAFLESKNTDNFNLGRSADIKQVSMFLSQKLYDEKNNYLGVAYIGLNLGDVEEFVLSKKFGEESNIMMLNKDGNIIINRDSSLLNVDNEGSLVKNIRSIAGLSEFSDELIAKKDITKKYIDKNKRKRIAISLYLNQLDAYLLMDVSSKELTRPVRVILYKTLLISVLFFISILVFMILLIRKTISSPVQEIICGSNEFAQGNLSQAISYNSNDELGTLAKNLELMRTKLLKIIGAVLAGSEAIQNAGNEIMSSSRILANGSGQQAAGVDELLALMENNQYAISDFVEVSAHSEKVASQSRKSIEKVKDSFDATMETLENIMDKIAKIKEIASKTDMLSINSSIEASRAGEAGKGFSVVAQEVKKLAEKSSMVATEIDELTQNSFDVAQKSLLLLNELAPLVIQIADSMHKVSETSIEQSNNHQKITSAIQQLNDVAQQNASTAEELSNASAIFFEHAKQFKAHTSIFKFRE